MEENNIPTFNGEIVVHRDPADNRIVRWVEHRPKRIPRKLKKALRTECPRCFNKTEAWLDKWSKRIEMCNKAIEKQDEESRSEAVKALQAEFPDKKWHQLDAIVWQCNNDIAEARKILLNEK